MANLTEYLTTKYTKLIAEITADLGKTAEDLAMAQNIIRALKNPDTHVDGAAMTLSRIQVMENGDIRITPPPTDPDIETTYSIPT
jgi:hypothetical protein